jgi:hypothetical protein
MRRLALATLLGSLVLAACSDQTQQTPTEPGVSLKPGSTPVPYACNTSPWVLNDLADVFPGGNGKTLLSSAREKINAIIQACQTGRLQDAQTKAMFFDDWMFKKFQGNLLGDRETSGPAVLGLFTDVLDGVGLNSSTITPDLVTSDAGTGVYECNPNCPTAPTTVLTELELAALQVPGLGFNETTLLIVDKLPNNTKLSIPPGQGRSQFAPFYDFNAINSSNQHVLNSGKFAHVEMCLYLETEYPPGYAIGHNPVFGAPGYPFEVLPPSDVGNLLPCEFGESGLASSVHRSGLQGLAVSVWQRTKEAATAVLLPNPLSAATLVVGSGSASGKTSSLSPFGIVGPAELGFTSAGDPSGETFTVNETLTWCFVTKGCFFTFPTVILSDEEGNGIGGVEISVTLVNVNGSPGSFTTEGEGASTTAVVTDTESGVATFSNLRITDPGTYRLRFSAGSGTTLISGEFTVHEFFEE